MSESVWGRLAPYHVGELRRHGFGEFKRTVNLNYGNWPVRKWWDRKILGLALRGCWSSAQVDWGDVSGLDWRPGELRAYALMTGLWWNYAQRHDRLGVLGLEEPWQGHPMPVVMGGRLISQDLAASALDLNRMDKYINLKEKRKVLEVGGGCGRLAWAFKKLFPLADYTIVDIEPARSLARRYLGELGIEVRFESSVIESERYDLAINTSSFDEMPAEVAQGYVYAIDRVCTGHVFLNGMGRASHDRDRPRLGLNELDYPKRWQVIYDRRHPVGWVHRWVEKVFEVAP